MLKPNDWVSLDTQIECPKLAQWKEYANGNHSQEDQLESPSLDGKMISGMMWRRWSLRSGQNKYRTALNGRILLRRPRLYQSCSAIEEEKKRALWQRFQSGRRVPIFRRNTLTSTSGLNQTGHSHDTVEHNTVSPTKAACLVSYGLGQKKIALLHNNLPTCSHTSEPN